MFAGGALGGLVALLVGWPCFRLSGHYYAIATVVVGEMVLLLVLNWDCVGGGDRHQHPVPHAKAGLWLQFRIDKLPYPLRGAGVRRGRLAGGLADRGLALGLRLARGEGRRRRGAQPRGADVPVQDGGGGDQRRDRPASAARSMRNTSATSIRTACCGSAVDADRAAGGGRRGRHIVGAAGRRRGADPGAAAFRRLARGFRQRRRSDDLWRADHGPRAGPPAGARQPVRRAQPGGRGGIDEA